MEEGSSSDSRQNDDVFSLCDESDNRSVIIGGEASETTSFSDIKCLTVRFNDHHEIWRSPPSIVGVDNIAWPLGWIEVHKTGVERKPLGPNSVTDDLKISKFSTDDEIISNIVPSLCRIEYHPPFTSKFSEESSIPICYSIDEAKKYFEQHKYSKRKLHHDSESDQSTDKQMKRIRSKSPRKASSCNLESDQQSLERSSRDLHKIMISGSALSKAMRCSIIHAAVRACKNRKCRSKFEFLGVDGKMYQCPAENFGRYVNMRACGECKLKSQGVYMCRMIHRHLFAPDWNRKHNSAEFLIELFRKSEQDLQENVMIEEKADYHLNSLNDARKSDTLAECRTKYWSMDQLGEDLLYHIASFLTSFSDLISFCRTSKRAHLLLESSTDSELLFRGIFLKCFGKEKMIGNFESNLTWKERWAMIRGLRRGLMQQSVLNQMQPQTLQLNNSCGIHLKGTVGVLNPDEENDAIYYDNTIHSPTEGLCNGYFGMKVLHLLPPPKAKDDWQPPVILHGDFNGIKVFHSLQDAIISSRSSNHDSERANFLSLGDGVEGGQVLSLLLCEKPDVEESSNKDGDSPPCCFVGYASGKVAAMTATLSDDGKEYIFQLCRECHAHNSEVTALAFVTYKITPRKTTKVLLSACCEGKVYFYPDALNAKRNFSMESTLAFSNFNYCPIFSMASTIIESKDHESISILCTGDRDGNIRLWFVSMHSSGGTFYHLNVYKSGIEREESYHLVTKTVFIQNHILVTGSQNGDIRIWHLEYLNNCSRSTRKGALPKLILRHDLSFAHNGIVEVCLNIGDILLTSGGNDGKLVGWDIFTGVKIGSLHCHQGRELYQPDTGNRHIVKSCVVDLILNGRLGRLISLCRDGVLKEWIYGDLFQQNCYDELKLNLRKI